MKLEYAVVGIGKVFKTCVCLEFHAKVKYKFIIVPEILRYMRMLLVSYMLCKASEIVRVILKTDVGLAF